MDDCAAKATFFSFVWQIFLRLGVLKLEQVCLECVFVHVCSLLLQQWKKHTAGKIPAQFVAAFFFFLSESSLKVVQLLYFIRKWHRKTSLTWHLLLAVLHVNQFTKCCILDNYFLPMSLNEGGPISLCACLMELGCFGFYLLNKSTNPILPLVA